MPAPTVFIPTRGFVGLGVEAVHGTAVASSVYAPILDESFAKDPGIILDHLIRATKDTEFNPVIGEQKLNGAINTLIWLDTTMMLVGASIGTDAYQTGGASSGGVAIPAMASGLLTVSLVAQTSTPIAVGDYIEFRQATGVASATNLSEIHKVTAVTGSGPYAITWTDHATYNAYTTSGQAYRIAAASPSFQHALLPDVPDANTYRTLTIEKNLAGIGSQQFANGIISKANFKFATKDTGRATYDFIASTDTSIAATTPSFQNSFPLALNNYGLTVSAVSDNSIASFEIDIDNGGKEIWTFSGQNLPTTTLPASRAVSGKWTNVAQNLNFYNDLGAATLLPLVFTATQGSNSLAFTLPNVVIDKGSLPLKIGDALMYDISFKSPHDNTAGNSISALFTSTTIYAPVC